MNIPIATRTRSSEAPAGPPRRGTPWSVALVAAALGAAALPGASHAQPSPLDEPPAAAAVDQRWRPWLGCWQLVEETGALPQLAGALPSFADRVLVCVTPAAAATDVVVRTLADGEAVLEETLSADGVEHPVDQAECRGRRRIAWSDDGERLFTRAELSCSDQDARRVSGVGLMTDGRTWLDLELVEAGQRAAVSVRRYRRAGDVTTLSAAGPTLTAALLAQARAAAGRTGAADLTIDDVIGAATAVEPAVLEAMLVETDTMFDLDGRTLIRLDDGGVPDEVIDLLVALSFPDEFAVQRPGAPTAAWGGGGGGGFVDMWSGFGSGYRSWYPYYAAPFGYYYGWSPYSAYGWSPYGSLYPWDPINSYSVGPSVVGPESDRPRGRVYEGYGFTRLAPGTGDGERRAQPRGTGAGATSGGSRSGAPSSASGSGGGGRGRVSSQGFTRSGGSSSSGGRSASGGGRSASGGGGSSSGRTATPREP